METFLSAVSSASIKGSVTIGPVTLIMLILITIFAFFFTKYRKKVQENIIKPFPGYFKIVVIIQYIAFVIGFVIFQYISYLRRLEYFPDVEFRFAIGWLLLPAVYNLLFSGIYYIPYIVAHFRSHSNTTAIFILNLLAGWTVLAWIGALIWEFIKPQPKVIVDSSDADALKKFKELYDSGAITEEEYLSKKQSILHK